MTNKELNNVVENIDAMGSIASGIRSSDEIKKIFKLFLEDKITGEEAKQRILKCYE